MTLINLYSVLNYTSIGHFNRLNINKVLTTCYCYHGAKRKSHRYIRPSYVQGMWFNSSY